MSSHYYTIKKDSIYEIEIKKSRFICSLYRIKDEEQAKSIITKIKKEHWKANHNCSAYVLGENQEIQRSSDDGEPSGTAGVPMLEVLKVKELQNVLAVVTRYFGGTKLGAGGLIRAYSQSVSEALLNVGLVEGTLQQELIVKIEYSNHSKVEYFTQQEELIIKESQFTDKVTLIIMVDEDNVKNIQEKLINLLNNQCELSLGNTDYIELDLT
ncbi:YigZ family protein [Vagococcus sp.]|uniref:YigZ family protein n=1 Tax=Vagococcus sp. TaxID=1933889 RepID=UPI003F9E2092